MLVLPHPLHTHRSSNRLRQQGGLRSRVIACESSVGTGGFHPYAAHFVQRQTQHGGQVPPISLYPLRTRPEGCLPVADISYSARWSNHAVILQWSFVSRFYDLDRASETRGNISARHIIRSDLFRISEPVVFVLRKRDSSGPGRSQLSGGLNRLFFALGNNTEKVALPDNLDQTGNVSNRILINTHQGCPGTRRENHSSVDHSWNANIVNVWPGPGHLSGNVDARNRLAD